MALFLLWGMAIQIASALSTDSNSTPIDGDIQPIPVGGVYNPGQTITATFSPNLPPFTMVFSAAGAAPIVTAISLIGEGEEYPLIVPTMTAENVVLLVDISTGTIHSTFPIGKLAIVEPTITSSSGSTSATGSGSAGQTTTTTNDAPNESTPAGAVMSTSISSPSSIPTTASANAHKSRIPAIVGGVVSGVMGLIVGAVLLFVWNRGRKRAASGRDPTLRNSMSSEPILNAFRVSPFVEDGPPNLREDLPTLNVEKPRHQTISHNTRPFTVEDSAGIRHDTSSSLRVNRGRNNGHHGGRISRKAHRPIPQILVPPEEQQPASKGNEQRDLPAAVEEKENFRVQEEGSMPAELPHINVDELFETDGNRYEESEADAAATAIAFHHQDSGIRVPIEIYQARSEVIEFPPAYSAI
ncbi:hypothetical protein BT96DRAFT_923655 [Gymnopus androsaceus JB14]|uniref:Mid2 domain-containing protein n=1 Tax=Gymnopus androsaceus JB14 TaxID=1447944 RepID=A0A6A4H978_9AGAR|nr:hypothetical protein BT96DRAFT_923655 [Gymnopus androsaceus JB14]